MGVGVVVSVATFVLPQPAAHAYGECGPGEVALQAKAAYDQGRSSVTTEGIACVKKTNDTTGHLSRVWVQGETRTQEGSQSTAACSNSSMWASISKTGPTELVKNKTSISSGSACQGFIDLNIDYPLNDSPVVHIWQSGVNPSKESDKAAHIDVSGAAIGRLSGQNGGVQGNAGGLSEAPGEVSGYDDKETSSCESSSGFLAPIGCGIINGLAATSDGIFNSFIVPFLQVSPINLDNPNDPTIKAWSNIRNIANVLLLLALAGAVVGRAVGGDTYAIKKMVPRLLIAAVLLNVSIYLVAGLVDIFNILGHAIGDLIVEPFKNGGKLEYKLSFGATATTLAALVAFAFAVVAFKGPFLMFLFVFVLLPVLLAFLAVFITLLIRQALILLLVLVSPVAFVLYALPNTEEYFKKWWELLVKSLLVYPIMVALFALSQVLALLLTQANATSGPRAALAGIAAMIAVVIPLFAVPYAFKIAGGAIGGFATALAAYQQRVHEGILGNPNLGHSLQNRVRRDLGNRVVDYRANKIKTLDRRSAVFQSRRGTRSIGRAVGLFSRHVVGGQGVIHNHAVNQKNAMDRIRLTTGNGSDAFIRASTIPFERLDEFRQNYHQAIANGMTASQAALTSRYRVQSDGTEQWQSGEGQWHGITRIRQGNQYYGDETSRVAAFNLVLDKAKSGSVLEQDRLYSDFVDSANQLGMSEESAMGHWQNIADPYKGTRLDFKNKKIVKENGRLVDKGVDHGGMVKDYANMNSYDQRTQTEGGYRQLGKSVEEIFNNPRNFTAQEREDAWLATKNLTKYVSTPAQVGMEAFEGDAAGRFGAAGSRSAAYKNSHEAEVVLEDPAAARAHGQANGGGGGTP
jgi:hypothetical protein